MLKTQSITSRTSYTAICIGVVFFLIGVFSVFIEAILPVLKVRFGMSYTVFSLFDTSFFICYALFSYILARFISKVGINRGLVIGLLILTAGCLAWFTFLRFQGSNIYQYLLATFIIATGVVVLLIVAELAGLYFTGSAKKSHLSMFQSSDSVGAFIAPLILTQLLFRSVKIDGYHLEVIASIFFVCMLLLVLFTVIVKSIDRPIIENEKPADAINNTDKNIDRVSLRWIWLAIFIYVGIEVTIGTFIINVGIYHYHLAANHASWSLSLYWFLFIVGRLLGGLYLGKIADHWVINICCLTAIALLLLALHTTTAYGLYALITVGLCNAVLFPLLYSLGLMCSSRPSILLSGKLASAISGGAIIPLIAGWIAEHYTVITSLYVGLLCYITLIIIGFIAIRNKMGSSHGQAS